MPMQFYSVECPVCGHTIGKLFRPKQDEVGKPHNHKRSCPKCHRRFLFTIVWFPDKRCAVSSDRIADYVHAKRR